MSKRPNICIVGCGRFAAFYARLLQKMKIAKLYFSSRTEDKAKAYQQRFKGAGHFVGLPTGNDLQALDGLMIFTPHHLHLDNVKALAGSNKYILLQKPLAHTLQAAQEIAQLCDNSGLNLMIGENFLYMPALKKIKALIEHGDLGKPLWVQMRDSGGCIPQDWRRKKEYMGGGILIDLGIHYLSALRYLFGEPLTVQDAFASYESEHMEGETAIAVNSKMASGTISNLNLAWHPKPMRRERPSIVIVFEAGMLSYSLGSVFMQRNKGLHCQRLFAALTDRVGHKALLRNFCHLTANRLPIDLDHQLAFKDMLFVSMIYEALNGMEGNNAPKNP